MFSNQCVDGAKLMSSFFEVEVDSGVAFGIFGHEIGDEGVQGVESAALLVSERAVVEVAESTNSAQGFVVDTDERPITHFTNVDLHHLCSRAERVEESLSRGVGFNLGTATMP
jgi:hypothetical protein